MPADSAQEARSGRLEMVLALIGNKEKYENSGRIHANRMMRSVACLRPMTPKENP